MKQNIVYLICVIIIGMLLVPVTSGLNVVKKSNVNTVGNSKISVDTNIRLTKAKLPLLQKAVSHIDNPEVHRLVQAIIGMLSTKNVVTSKDIQQIMTTLDIRETGVYTGPIIGGGAGEAHSLPGYIFEETLGGYVGPVIVGSWITDGTTKVGFSLTPVSGYHKGYVVGFFGIMTLNMWEHGLLYGMIGVSCLTIISSQ